MKKVIALILTLIMVLALCACGSDAETPADKPADTANADAPPAADTPSEPINLVTTTSQVVGGPTQMLWV